MSKKPAETPLMKQHREIKSKYPDAVLLFRVGDFYETFAEDALIAARVLGITLTKRANGAASSIELAGFPHHSLDTYLHKLVKAGYRVAICDQLEDPKQAKGIVKRGVTELVTPGVAVNDKILNHNSNNFLAALHFQGQEIGVSFLDISTGEFFVGEGQADYIDKLLQGFQPSEVLVAKPQMKKCRELFGNQLYYFALEDWLFQYDYTYDLLLQHFKTHSLKGFGIEEMSMGIVAAGAVLFYLRDTAHPDWQHINKIQPLIHHDFLWMDRFTIRNLELLPGNDEHQKSLLTVMDTTQTPMGARMMRRWMVFPLFRLELIQQRQEVVTALITEPELFHFLQNTFQRLGDLERLISKVPLRKANPRELIQLSKSLLLNDEIKAAAAQVRNKTLQQFLQSLPQLSAYAQHIQNILKEDAPVMIQKGGAIKEGVHAELDELRNISKNGKNYLLQVQQREMESTGISSLKVGFNNVFGYYLEVTHTHKDKVPDTWLRKQTLTNAERYITQELKEYEEKILGAEDKIMALEQQLFQELLSYLEPHIAIIQQGAHILAQIDCLLSFARSAIQRNYSMPHVHEGFDLQLKESRHPVIESRMKSEEQYIPNDVYLNKDELQIIILTGPNMSGKSALLRQVALITLMAHMGSFVPATAAKIPLTDKIFTRVGASDNISDGESTFMVEMNESAGIINNVSERSLVVLDEIGRGTSTYDGISIAWSIAAYLHEHATKPKTLFATHYHELNELEQQYERIKNYHITYKETGNNVLFLRKLEQGGSRHSFGIQVARMAGMPQDLIDHAEKILALLEDRHTADQHQKKLVHAHKPKQYQLNIFDGLADDLRMIQQTLNSTDVNTLTPVEALLKLNELKSIVKQYQ